MIDEDCPICGGKPFRRELVETEEDHLEFCNSDYHKIVEREAGGYQYLNEKFEILDTTSVPITDRAALDYFSRVAVWFPSSLPVYILRRALGEREYKMMPFKYDPETKEVNSIGATA